MNCFCEFFNCTLNFNLCKFILNTIISPVVKCSRGKLSNLILNEIIILIFKHFSLILLNFNHAMSENFIIYIKNEFWSNMLNMKFSQLFYQSYYYLIILSRIQLGSQVIKIYFSVRTWIFPIEHDKNERLEEKKKKNIFLFFFTVCEIYFEIKIERMYK